MTVVFGTHLADGRCYMASDSAIGFEHGFRTIMTEGKWWRYDDLLIGESGEDMGLSRVRAKFEASTRFTTPALLADCIRDVADDLAGKGNAPVDVPVQLLYLSPEHLCVLNGDGGVVRQEDYACIGHGGAQLHAWLDKRLPPRSKRTYRKTNTLVRQGLRYVARYCDSVSEPFFDVVEP